MLITNHKNQNELYMTNWPVCFTVLHDNADKLFWQHANQAAISKRALPCKKARGADKLQLLARKDKQPLEDKELPLVEHSRPERGMGFNELWGQETCSVINSQKISLSIQENPHSAVLPPSLELKFNLVSKGRGKTCIIKRGNQRTMWRKRSHPHFCSPEGLKEKLKIQNCSALTRHCWEWERWMFHPRGLSLPFFQ